MNSGGRVPSARPVRVLLIEDHPVVREGLANLLEREGCFLVVGRADSARSARTLAPTCGADVIVLDLVLQDDDGLALIGELADLAPRSRVLVFSLQSEGVYAQRCLRAGAHGYVQKQEPLPVLYVAIRAIADGQLHVSARVAAAAVAGLRHKSPEPIGDEAALTDRELHIYRLTGQAIPTRDIAEALGISVKTVEAHRENIKNKLRVDTHVALVARAAQWVQGHVRG